jgi:lactate permease
VIDAAVGPLLAAAPILTVLGLMLGARWSAARAGSAGLALALFLGLALFDLGSAPGGALGGATGALAEAAFTSLTILWIIVPALAIHRLQTATGAVDVLRGGLAAVSGDPRLTALLVAWFFALLIEGAAGFGTAAALAAPFLVALGLPAVSAVAAALLGHAVGVSFGAVGTPIVPQAAATGLPPLELAAATAIYGAALGWLLLAALTWLLARARDGAGWGGSPGWRLWAWSALAGVLFLMPFFGLASWVGPELPTLGGSVLGGGVFVGALLAGARSRGRDRAAGVRPPMALRAAAPYIALVGLVLVTRLLPPLRDALQALEWRWQLSDGAYGGAVQLLYHPGTMLFLALLLGAASQRAEPALVRSALADTLRRSAPVFVALLVMLGMARLLVHAGMIESLAAAAALTLGGAWPALAPAVGALGTFVTGSATASNALFTDLQAATAEAAGVGVTSVLGGQGFGAAVGNVIAPHNLIAAAAVVGLAGREAEILRRTLPVALLMLALAGILGLLLG